MSLARTDRPQRDTFFSDGRSSYFTNSNTSVRVSAAATIYNCDYDYPCNTSFGTRNYDSSSNFSRSFTLDGHNYDFVRVGTVPTSKRRKVSALSGENTVRPYQRHGTYENCFVNFVGCYKHVPPRYSNSYCDTVLVHDNSSAVVTANRPNHASTNALTTSKCDRSMFEDDENGVFMSRDEIKRCSPSSKDGIDALYETHLRYSYCAFLQNLGVQLDLPQTTIGTAMVLCHRFFSRRSHASHDRFLIATAVLFLAAKSEETPCALNDVLQVSCEILHKQELALLLFMLPIDWFDQYRERIIEAEQLILTTLNFVLNVQHPYESLTSTLQKLGFSQSVLANLALNLVSEGLRSSLWLQFKPYQIAAGAAYLGAKFLNMNLASCHSIWNEFHTPPSILKDIAHQLMELF